MLINSDSPSWLRFVLDIFDGELVVNETNIACSGPVGEKPDGEIYHKVACASAGATEDGIRRGSPVPFWMVRHHQKMTASLPPTPMPFGRNAENDET